MSMMKKLIAGILLFSAIGGLAIAEETEIYAPFVSRLKAAVRGPQIKLSWKDSPDVKGTYLVYRATKEITSDNFKDATFVGSVESGSEYFIDSPAEKGEFFYAVVARTPEGKMFDVFIPFRNKTMKGIEIATVAEEKDLAATITGIKARIDQGKVEITFKTSRADRDLILYRSTSPLLSADKLSLANVVSRLKSSDTLVYDYPVPGIPYYYAIVDSKLLETGNVPLISGESASVAFVEIPLPAKKEETIVLPELPPSVKRPMPLPYFLLATEVGTGKDLETKASVGLPQAKQVSAETSKAIAALVEKTQPVRTAERIPEILDIDKALGGSKEEYTLKTILDGSFARKDWKDTEKLLRNFLSLHLSDDMRIRARFYLGQALFYQERIRESVMEFLLASNRYYAETRPWIETLLRRNRITSRPSEG